MKYLFLILLSIVFISCGEKNHHAVVTEIEIDYNALAVKEIKKYFPNDSIYEYRTDNTYSIYIVPDSLRCKVISVHYYTEGDRVRISDVRELKKY